MEEISYKVSLTPGLVGRESADSVTGLETVLTCNRSYTIDALHKNT
jgi:hypothetical protein